MASLTIHQTTITDASPCYLIAEVGHNHGGDPRMAQALLYAAWSVGANAYKVQTRHNRSLFTKAAYDAPYPGRNSYGATYGEHREALELSRVALTQLWTSSRQVGIDFISTAFDPPSGEKLARIGVDAIKTASASITNTVLLDALAQLGLPLIVSTGTASLDDVDRAVDIFTRRGAAFALLQCTAVYPCPTDLLNLRVIETYRQRYGCVVGFSSHDESPATACAAYALGARIIERHFTLNRQARGSDHHFSLTPAMFQELRQALDVLPAALGDGQKRRLPEEAPAIVKMAQSLYVKGALPAGHVLTAEDIVIKSPGGGLKVWQRDLIVGSRLRRAVEAEELLSLEMLAREAA